MSMSRHNDRGSRQPKTETAGLLEQGRTCFEQQAWDDLAAARAAFWLGFRLLARGDAGHAGGWLARSQRLVEREGRDCVEQGYLLLPVAHRHLHLREFGAAHDAA